MRAMATLLMVLLASAAATDYGDPASGPCAEGEDVVQLDNGLVNGTVCAPDRKNGTMPGGVGCHLGGVGPDPTNGCPTGVPKPQGGGDTKAPWPVCLMLPTPGKDFHCLLVCGPCTGAGPKGAGGCVKKADDVCPSGGVCMVGMMMRMSEGLCVYPNKTQAATRKLALKLDDLAGSKKASNVLFIAADDMRPEISVYGHKYMHTPQMQALADDGYAFRRSYVQQALCAPSRTVLLTGKRPDTSKVWTIGPFFRDIRGQQDWVTMPEFFKQAGFVAAGAGKLFHTGSPSGLLKKCGGPGIPCHRGGPSGQCNRVGGRCQPNNTCSGNCEIIRLGDDQPRSWSLPYVQSHDGYNNFNNYSYNGSPPAKVAPSAHRAKTPRSNIAQPGALESFNDVQNALAIIGTMRNLTANGSQPPAKPFFLACGFHRPHIPWVYPEQFNKHYPAESVEYPPSKGFSITKGVPVMAPHDWTGEGSGYGDLSADAKGAYPGLGPPGCNGGCNVTKNIPSDPDPKSKTRSREYDWNTMCNVNLPVATGQEMKRAYWSCISYVDHMIGMLVDELKSLKLYEDTTIIFWTDHGYKLGEHCDWFKHDNYEASTRIVTIVKPANGLLDGRGGAAWPRGTMIEGMIEEVDMYPSLADLHKLPVAPRLGLQGKSWVPLLLKTNPNTVLSGLPRAFSQYPHFLAAGAGKGICANSSDPTFRQGSQMGYSMRTPLYRYTEWTFFPCATQCVCANATSSGGKNANQVFSATKPPMTCGEKCGTQCTGHTCVVPNCTSSLHRKHIPTDGTVYSPFWSNKCGVELYNHTGDPSGSNDKGYFGSWENENLAHLPENKALVAQLSAELHQFWPKALYNQPDVQPPLRSPPLKGH